MRGKGEEPSASLNKNSKGLVRKQMLELQWRFEQRITDQKIKVYKSLSDLLESPQRDEGTPRQTHTHTHSQPSRLTLFQLLVLAGLLRAALWAFLREVQQDLLRHSIGSEVK